MTQTHAPALRNELLRAARERAVVRSAWIILRGETAPRLLELLAVVALLEDINSKNLVRDQVGTIVERLASGVYEAAFSDDDGRACASTPIQASHLLPLRHEPSHVAA